MARGAARWATLALSAVVIVASSTRVQVLVAQDLNPGNRPALSPWFNLYQRNGGPLDNYHMFVRPQIELSNTLEQHQASLQRNAAKAASLSRDVTQLQEQGKVRPTGTGSVFMYYSHYYPAPGSGGGASRRH